MIKYTALLRCSFKFNHRNTQQFLIFLPPNSSFQPLLVGRIQFLESSLKRRQLKFNQSFVAFPEHLKTQINDFPYCKIPKHTQHFTQNRQLSEQQYQMLTAFNSLFIVNEQYKQDLLRQILKILLKQDYNKVKLQNLTGEKVFTYYYQKKLPTIIRQINQNLIQQNQKVYYLQILTNLLPTESVKSLVKTINEKVILASNVHVQSLYLKLKIKHDCSYVDIVQSIYSHLTSYSKDQQQKIKLSAAKALISISNYEQFLPQNFQNLSLQILIENIDRLSAMENIMIIKHIYMSKSDICRQYMQVLTHKVVKLHKQNKGQQLHVPLILKMIKYRKKQNLSNQMFVQIINSYPEKFNTVFREKNTNKQIFMSLLTKQSNNSLNNDLKMQFGSYITKLFEEYQKKQQIDQQELVKNMKLILKYTSQLNKQQVTKVISILLNNLYERMKHVASQQTKYYVFLITYTCDYNEKLAANKSFRALIQQISAFYDKQCLQQPNYENITKAINIEYQLCRREADSQLRLDIFKYDYTNVELHISVYSYLFYLMKKERNFQKNQKARVLDQLKTKIYKDLSNGRFSMKMVYTLIDVLVELKYDDKYLYRDIEKNIGNRLRRTLQGNKKQIPLVKDLHFMKDKLMREEKCSKKLAELIVQGQQNYDRIQELVQNYLQKSKNWQKMRQNFARNKSKQTKKYQKFENK